MLVWVQFVIGALPHAGMSVIVQEDREMKKLAGGLRICLGKKWEGVGMEIKGTKNLAVDKHDKSWKGFDNQS